MNLEWYDLVGLAGTLAILVAFFLLQARRLSGTGLTYQLLNLFGAAGVLVSLVGTFNLSVALLESAWILVSAYGIVRSVQALFLDSRGESGAARAALREAQRADPREVALVFAEFALYCEHPAGHSPDPDLARRLLAAHWRPLRSVGRAGSEPP